MGKRGPIAKPAEEAQGHRKRSLVSLPAPKTTPAPRPPAGMLKSTRDAWRGFWQSGLATSIEDVDMPVLRRLFRYRDAWERSQKVMAEAPIVKGSMGQPRVNPLADYIKSLEGSMLRLELELGLTPMARARLGITLTQALTSLDDMNALFNQDTDGPDGDDADPRLAPV